jgi:pimeloyl-ACP methyl ester carboxylesterase
MTSVRSLTVDAGGPVHVADFGGAGQPLVLVHGLGGCHLNWLAVAPQLAARHRVFAVDLPGFGLTALAGRRSTVPANVVVLDRVLTAIATDPVILVGNSMGGLISLGEGSAHPERIAGLVLVNAALPRPRGLPLGLDPILREYLFVYLPAVVTWQVRRMARAGGAETVVRRILRDCTVDVDRIAPEIIAAHVDFERERLEAAEWSEALRVAVRSLLRVLAHRAFVERWVHRTTVPTLLMHGRHDRVVPFAAGKAVADMRPDWAFHVFEDAGHVPMLEVPGDFVDALRSWLASQPWYDQAPSVPAALAG